MTGRVVYSRRATAEVEEITASLAEDSQPAADRFSQALARAEQQLYSFPIPARRSIARHAPADCW